MDSKYVIPPCGILNMCAWGSTYVYVLEVCTGSNWSPNPARTRDCLTQPDPTRAARLNLEPEPDPRSPPPPTNSQQKKKGKRLHFTIACKEIDYQGSAISHKHLPVMKVCEHQVAAVAYILPSLWILYGQEDNSSTVQIMVIFCQLRLVSILSTLNQT